MYTCPLIHLLKDTLVAFGLGNYEETGYKLCAGFCLDIVLIHLADN